MRHTHADADGEREHAERRENAEQGVGRRRHRRKGTQRHERSQPRDRRHEEREQPELEQRLNVERKTPKTIAGQADVQVFVDDHEPEQTERQKQSVHRRRLMGCQLASGSGKMIPQNDSRRSGEQRQCRDVEVGASRADDAAPECAPLILKNQRCPSHAKSPASGFPAYPRYNRSSVVPARASSETVWQQTTSPLTIIANRSTRPSTISRMCEVRKTDAPRAASPSNKSLILRDEPGSIPSNGSSRKSTRGLCSSAIANAHYCRMPVDALSTSVVRPCSSWR